MFKLEDFGAAGKRLNAEYLKTIPDMKLKGTITGGGVAGPFADGKMSPFLKVTSSTYEGEKELLLNATNRAVLAAAFGKQPEAWIGKEIGVYFDPTVVMGGKAVGGVRVKPLVAAPSFEDAPKTHTLEPATADDIPF